jgi:hypothetical protein
MRYPGFGWGRRTNRILGLCLCLVLITLINAGAIAYTQHNYADGMLTDSRVCRAEPLQGSEADYPPSAVGGSLPVIQMFKAKPMVLDTADSAAAYGFKVTHAAKVQIVEAGTVIKEIDNPTLATLKGGATGLPASAIMADESGNFITVLIASNNAGSVNKVLALSLSPNLLPAGLPSGQSGATDNQTEPRSPKWLAQYSGPLTSVPSAGPKPGSEPEFFKCPSGCEYCLQPGDAASGGFNQRCSEERCYYSPDNQQSWYCYKPAPGWCCTNGNVIQNTKDECTKIGGFWSTSQAEALQRCQPLGYCCMNGNIYQATVSQCSQAGGTYYDNVIEAKERCQPPCWCCLRGQVFQTSQTACLQSGGNCYASQAQALEYCRTQTTCWCCAGGKVFQAYQSQCSQVGGTCYATQDQAQRYCGQQTPTTPYLK